MERVLKDARGEESINSKANGVNGNTKENGTNGVTEGMGKRMEDGGIRIPEKAVNEGIKVVKKELQTACDITFDDEN